MSYLFHTEHDPRVVIEALLEMDGMEDAAQRSEASSRLMAAMEIFQAASDEDRATSQSLASETKVEVGCPGSTAELVEWSVMAFEQGTSPADYLIRRCPRAQMERFHLTITGTVLDNIANRGTPVLRADEELVEQFAPGLLARYPEMESEVVAALEAELLWCAESDGSDVRTHLANIRFLSEVLIQQGVWTGVLEEVLASKGACGTTPRLMLLMAIRKTRPECEEMKELVLGFLERMREQPLHGERNYMDVQGAMQTMEYLKDRDWMQDFIRDVIVNDPGWFYPSLDTVAGMVTAKRADDFSPERHELRMAVEKLDAVTEKLDWTRESQLRR